jgi:arabinan endo-1,5-alpha-L-arabinosidase
MKTLIFALVFALVGCTSNIPSSSTQSETIVSIESSSTIITTYSNPVWEPVLADPSIIRCDEDQKFYAFGTEDLAVWGGTDYSKKLIPILVSDDLVTWSFAGSVFANPSSAPYWGAIGAGLWAPEVVKINNKYLVYYSLSIWGDPDPGIGVASADHPLGPYTDHGKLFTSNEIGVKNSIDQTVVVDNGKVYMIWGSFIGIYGIELSSDGLSILHGLEYAKNNKVLLAGVDNGRFEISNYEGAYVRKKDEYYYMFLSTGTCCAGFSSSYRVVVARSTNIMGPYVDAENRLMTSQQNIGTNVVRGNDRFVGVGHNAWIEDDAGEYFIVYHGFDKTKDEKEGVTNRRSLLIDVLVWNSLGWPYVENYGASINALKPTIN